MADIQQNTSEGSGAMTAIVAILVIVIIALAVYFGFFRNNAPAGGNDINVELNNPAGGTVPTGSGGGSATQ